MSIFITPDSLRDPFFGTFNKFPIVQEVAVGNLITANIVMSDELHRTRIPKDEIKKRLAFQVAEKMIENGLISFTKSENYIEGTTSFYARAILMPQERIEYMRRAKDIP